MSSSSDDGAPTLRDRLVSTFPLFDRSTSFVPWVKAHQAELDTFDGDVDTVQQSLQIAHAEGLSLDLIGAEFGQIGLRRGRNDNKYRAYLQSIVPAYQGRGTAPDVRFSVAAGLVIDESDVVLLEDFDRNQYDIELHNWNSHATGIVHEMADLADPVSVPGPSGGFGDDKFDGSDDYGYVGFVRYVLDDAIVSATATSTATIEKRVNGLGTDAFDGDGAFASGVDDNVRVSTLLGTASVVASIAPVAMAEITGGFGSTSAFGAGAFDGSADDEDIVEKTTIGPATTIVYVSPMADTETTIGFGPSRFGAGVFDGTGDPEGLEATTMVSTAIIVATASPVGTVETRVDGLARDVFDGDGAFGGGTDNTIRATSSLGTAEVAASVTGAAMTEIRVNGLGADTLDGSGAFGGGTDSTVSESTVLPTVSATATASSATSTDSETDGFGADTFDGTSDFAG